MIMMFRIILPLKSEPTLKGYRYKVSVDQFPITVKVVDVYDVHSTHVETVVLMSKVKG